MWFGLITLFPEVADLINFGLIGKARQNELITLECFNPRDYTLDKHRSVDDKPYGGGPGMLMSAPPLKAAIHAAKQAAKAQAYVVYLSPQGERFTQKNAHDFITQHQALILIAGRYEGIDQRIIEQEVNAEWSIGDYILTGGELPALIVIDALARLLPGVLGDQTSVDLDTFTTGLLKYPQYTRPEDYNGSPVPSVLRTGNHVQIERWRRKQALGRTWQKRPDILAQYELSAEDRELLAEFIRELSCRGRP